MLSVIMAVTLWCTVMGATVRRRRGRAEVTAKLYGQHALITERGTSGPPYVGVSMRLTAVVLATSMAMTMTEAGVLASYAAVATAAVLVLSLVSATLMGRKRDQSAPLAPERTQDQQRGYTDALITPNTALLESLSQQDTRLESLLDRAAGPHLDPQGRSALQREITQAQGDVQEQRRLAAEQQAWETVAALRRELNSEQLLIRDRARTTGQRRSADLVIAPEGAGAPHQTQQPEADTTVDTTVDP